MTITMYGIPNCDTIKKARNWLEGQGIAYTFHDFRADGLDEGTLEGWIGKVGWPVLLNKASTTFRGLSDADKQDLSEDKVKALLLDHPTMIKRPVLDMGKKVLVGFKPDIYAAEVKA
ncbi:ArsC family reductase [Aquamicrobium lusatiense]|uniref:ArsC family reductase n=1 Tax=Aquamicrobium lusatiense TaxID=89772 RepID=UPI002456C6A1|nr:ArsC family reductase [Aquamicrobium lusatiense]MDH4992566.1 ArsC family reductase [Aquamicrobium lusatiense]